MRVSIACIFFVGGLRVEKDSGSLGFARDDTKKHARKKRGGCGGAPHPVITRCDRFVGGSFPFFFDFFFLGLIVAFDRQLIVVSALLGRRVGDRYSDRSS